MLENAKCGICKHLNFDGKYCFSHKEKTGTEGYCGNHRYKFTVIECKQLTVKELKEQFNKTGTNGFNTKPLWDGWLSCAKANGILKEDI